MSSTSDNAADPRTALEALFQSEDDRSPLSPREPGPSARVLEEIEDSSVLRNEPVTLLCPGCGEVVREYPQGLPTVIRQFTADCSECGSLERWSVIAIPTVHVEIASLADLEQLTTAFWERHMWAGIQTSEGCPRTREYCELFDEMAKRFNWSWRMHCPLCRRTLGELGRRYLDYHHWSESPDIGVCLCRDCHDVIGERQTDMDLDWRARKIGMMNKHDVQIARLSAREISIAGGNSIKELAHRLIDRYNVPFRLEELECLLTQTLGNPEIREQILDDDVWQDLVSSE